MEPYNKLSACAGSWVGRNILHDPHSGKPHQTPSSVTVTSILDGRFIRLDYNWQYQESPQSGSMLVGWQDAARLYTLHWIDSWHMGKQVLACQGSVDGEKIVVEGSYAAPPGPDWGWRIIIKPQPGLQLEILMDNITPEGVAETAVEAAYNPAGEIS